MEKTIVVVIDDGKQEVAHGDSGLIETLADWASVNGYEHYIYESSQATGEYTDKR